MTQLLKFGSRQIMKVRNPPCPRAQPDAGLDRAVAAE
jgi:hypothetical protein